MKTVNIKGKEYVEVHQRILHLSSDEFPFDYDIQTEYQFFESQKMWVVKATLNIYLENRKLTYTGLAQEIIGDGYINKTSALENCETSAVGRACAMAGIGVIDGIASVDEINKAKAREMESKPQLTLDAAQRARKALEDKKYTKEQILTYLKKDYDTTGFEF